MVDGICITLCNVALAPKSGLGDFQGHWK